MAKTRHTSGPATVTVTTPDFGGSAEVARAAREVVLREVRAIVEAARARWPRKTGRSASALRVTETRTGVSVTNDAPYADQVREPGSGSTPAWEALVLEPLRAAVPRIAREAAEAAAVVALGGARGTR